ncbi:hypothetical protein E1297_01155, partial [Roseibium sp. RKSG952]|nr:hypothetical protein [Roseibium sp. RKSG952]
MPSQFTVLPKTDGTGERPKGNLPEFKKSSLILLFGIAAIQAIIVAIAKAAPSFGWQPMILLLWSFFGASLLQAAALIFQKEVRTGSFFIRTEPSTRNRLLKYMLVTGLLIAAPNAITFAITSRVGAGFVTLMFALPLVLTYALSLLFGLEKRNLVRLA